MDANDACQRLEAPAGGPFDDAAISTAVDAAMWSPAYRPYVAG